MVNYKWQWIQFQTFAKCSSFCLVSIKIHINLHKTLQCQDGGPLGCRRGHDRGGPRPGWRGPGVPWGDTPGPWETDWWPVVGDTDLMLKAAHYRRWRRSLSLSADCHWLHYHHSHTAQTPDHVSPCTRGFGLNSLDKRSFVKRTKMCCLQGRSPLLAYSATLWRQHTYTQARLASSDNLGRVFLKKVSFLNQYRWFYRKENHLPSALPLKF